MSKKRVLSGIQPTNTPHLGNYLGAVKNWAVMQEDYEALYFIADLHALTVFQDPKKFNAQIYESYALLLSMGISTEKSIAFVQSHVPAHAELNWLLSCYTQFGELSRMTQFKDKSEKHPDNINAGLFSYPVLMAADILIYRPAFVPTGADQKQHIELARNIATRFNNRLKKTFLIPEPFNHQETAKIMSLSEPTKKMSKSDLNNNGTIWVTDSKDTIIKKFKRATTDSENSIVYREDDITKAGINNLIKIYCAATNKSISETESEFQGKGYGDFKCAVGEAVADMLLPCRERFAELIQNKEEISLLMKDGAYRANEIANRTLTDAKKVLGLIV